MNCLTVPGHACGTRRSHRISSVHLLIAHNCVADASFALVTMLPTLLHFATAPRFYGGQVGEAGKDV
jgi:hypothetical protein